MRSKWCSASRRQSPTSAWIRRRVKCVRCVAIAECVNLVRWAVADICKLTLTGMQLWPPRTMESLWEGYANSTVTLFWFFSHPRPEGWPHHGRAFSIYLCPLSFWLTLPLGVLSTSWCCPPRPCVVFLTCVQVALFLALSLSLGIQYYDVYGYY